MKGKICDWKDDKGFGFIVSKNRSDKIFFHISDIKIKERRPKIGDFVDFDLIRDDRQRLKAKCVIIKGLSSRKNGLVNQSNVRPIKRTILDYAAIIILFLSIVIGGFVFYQTKNLNKLVPFGVIAVAVIIVFSRHKKPKEKVFTCARCKAIVAFDRRTISAWNKGISKLYCSACHQKWLITQPELEQPGLIKSNKSGCLGVFMVFTLLPILTFAFIRIFSWLS